MPAQLVVNFDEAGVNIVPVSNWTMVKCGAKQVPITGKEDKRQVTLVLADNLAGEMLAPQVIYQGKTDKSHASFKFPSDWHVDHSANHWSNSETMQNYADNVLIPYIEDVRDALDLPLRQPAVAVLDVFAAHRTDEFLKKLRDNAIIPIYVSAGCTGELQPLDVSTNLPFKNKLKESFQEYYSGKVTAAINDGIPPADVKIDMRLSTLWPIHARWMLSAFDYLKANRNIILDGWRKSGIQGAINTARQAKE